MGRKREDQQKDWPANLYPNRGGFRYRNPDTGKELWLGGSQEQAFAVADALNELLPRNPDRHRRRPSPPRTYKTVADAVAGYRSNVVPGKHWGPQTARGYDIVLRGIERELGDR